MKTWLKGGIIGGIFGIFIWIINILFDSSIMLIFALPVNYLLVLVFPHSFAPSMTSKFLIYFIPLMFIILFYFIIGTLIGLIIRKIKSRNQQPSQSLKK